MWPELDDDPEVQARIASGVLEAPAAVAARQPAAAGAPAAAGGTSTDTIPTGDADSSSAPPSGSTPARASAQLTATKEGRNSALCFLAGVLAIVILGLFPDLRPSFESDGESVPIDMTTTIAIVMFVAAVAIMIVGRPDVKSVPDQSVFMAGMVSAIALFGIAWLTATFINAHEEYIVETVGSWVTSYVFVFALAVFIVAALTTSQSTATRTIVPIGLAAGLPPGLLTGMWAGGLGGVYALPANGTQIAAANFDLTGTTKLGTKLLDHSFFVPMLIMTVTTVLVGAVIGAIFY
jgi:anaerobic C4-dicarboxylate transporter